MGQTSLPLVETSAPSRRSNTRYARITCGVRGSSHFLKETGQETEDGMRNTICKYWCSTGTSTLMFCRQCLAQCIHYAMRTRLIVDPPPTPHSHARRSMKEKMCFNLNRGCLFRISTLSLMCKLFYLSSG